MVDINDFVNIMDFLLGPEFYKKHKKTISRIEYGFVDNGIWKKEGDLNSYILIAGGVMNDALQKIKADSKTFVMTKPILAVGLTFAVISMLGDILDSGVKWLQHFETSLLKAEVENMAIEEQVEKGIEAEEQEEQEIKAEVEGEEVNQGSDKGAENIPDSSIRRISGFNDYI